MLMVLYDYNRNAILNAPFKNNTTPELVRVHTWLIQYLLDHGLKPSALRVDNECPKALKRFFISKSIDFQRCPPNYHHTNQE